GVIGAAGGRVSAARAYLTIRLRIVFPAGVQIDPKVTPPPGDHFTAGPHCRLIVSPFGCAGGARGRPTVHAGIVPPACVREKWGDVDPPTPYNHFAASPHCGVIGSGLRGVIGASCCPDVNTRIISPTGIHPEIGISSTPAD